MTKHNNDDIFTAFIGAVVQQTKPLPAAVQLEFNKTDESFTIIDIERLAKLHPPLLAAYEDTHNWLINHSNERSKGLKDLPDSTFDTGNTASREISNAASDISNLTDLPKIINQIDTKAQPRGLRKFIGQILQTRDSVQSSRDIILGNIL